MTPTPTPLPSVTPAPPSSTSKGTIYFHVYPESAALTPITSALEAEPLSLAGENYTDLIMSNYIAGVLLGRTIEQFYPGVQYNKDYLYGTMLAQLLQENINTAEYNSPNCPTSGKVLAPCPDQGAVMESGQGGPYQINGFAYDLIYGLPSIANNPGFSLLNYVAIQKNMSLTFTQLGTPFDGKTPNSFNNLYFGPVLTTFFHLNDFASLIALGQTPWTPPAFATNFATCMNNLKAVANAPVDVLINYAYNQGFYGQLMSASTLICAKNVNSFVTQANGTAANPYLNAVDGFSNGVEANTSYTQYPYQVRFYLDQLYNQSTLVPRTENHVIFNTATLGTVFANVFGTLGYTNKSGVYSPPVSNLASSNIVSPSTPAMQAYNSTLSKVGVASGSLLDLSDSNHRATIFKLLETAMGTLEQNLGTAFSQKTSVQLP